MGWTFFKFILLFSVVILKQNSTYTFFAFFTILVKAI